MSEKIKMAVVGLGKRGFSMIRDVLLPMGEADIVALCDVYEDRCTNAADLVNSANAEQIAPKTFTDYHTMLKAVKLDAIYIATSWQTHLEIAIDAMNIGVAVASDVSGAYSIDQCFELVRTAQKSKTPCMLMENCCFGRDEMMIMNMVKLGVFGKVIHCSGGYQHDLRDEVAFGKENRHYRLNNYMHRNCENYPTHELGPIAKILDINHGNRMLTVSSSASSSAGLQQYVADKKPDDTELKGFDFVQGDIVTTVIKCARGETITIVLDTTLPRYYSRGLAVHGTKALFTEDNRSLFIDGIHNEFDFDWKPQYNNIDNYREQYDHPVWKKFLADGVQGGHDGMDWLEFEAFFDALKNNKPMPIDVYDMATWLAISVLSEESIAMGGHPVPVPDFTNGHWVES